MDLTRRALRILAAALLGGPAAASESGAADAAASETIQFTSSLNAGAWSSSRNLDDDPLVLPLYAVARLRWLPVPQARGVVELWGWNADFGAGDAALRPREAYVDVTQGPLEVRAGRQVVAWGRADRLNPTDVFGARRYTLLTPEDEDQRVGVDALHARLRAHNTSLVWVLEPNFRPSRIPLRAQPDVRFVDDDVARKRTAYGLKLDHEGGALDGSVSWYRGPDRLPDPTPVALGASEVLIRLQHNPTESFGLDFATVHGSLGFRGEFSYARPRDTTNGSPFRKRPFVYAVVGAERNFTSGDSLQVQLFHKHVSHFDDPARLSDPRLRTLALSAAATMDQRDADRGGIALRWARRWFNDALQLEVAALAAVPRDEKALRPRMRYQFGDHMTLVVGADLLRGDADSFLGQLRKNSTAFVMLQASL